jgi:hypothetical protein
MLICRSRFQPSVKRTPQAGFALLITITLLAFLVLLLVSLAALTRVETQVAGNNQQLAQARQNALMALNVALGELQRAAGPDQRTTAPAVLGENATAVMAANAADNGLGTPVNGSRYWTGVWGNKSAPETIFTAAPQPVLLRWLVSGNENGSAITAAADGHITAPTVAAVTLFNPTQPVTMADGSALAITATASTPLLVASKPAALLLGPMSAGSNVDAFVAAPLVEISANQVPGLSGPARVGRYAWWVGDEGVKAKFNLPDPYIANATPDSGTSANSRDSRYRLLAAQRNGIESISPFGGVNYPLADTNQSSAAYVSVGHTLTTTGMRLAAPGVNFDDLKKQVHALTTYSFGVLADSQFGGLRRDLTFHLDALSGDTFLAGRNILPDGATPLSIFSGSKYTAQSSLFSETAVNGGLNYTTLNLSPRLGPKWDQLESFYRTAYDHPVDLEVQPAVDVDVNPVKVQAAITPVILETRMLFAVKSGPKIDTAIVLILGNPYSRPLKASLGLNMRVTHHPFRYDSSWWGEELGLICNYIGPATPAPQKISSVFTRRQGNRSKNHSSLPSTPPLIGDYVAGRYFHSYYPILKFRAPSGANAPADPDAGHPGVLDEVLFQIPPGVLNLAPGEARAYRIKEGATLPSETVDGVNMKVVPLEEMSDSLPTYFTHVCDSRYVSDASVFSESSYVSGGSFQGALNVTSDRGAWGSSLDYTLTIPGKPQSALQQLSAGNTQTNTIGSTGVPSYSYSQMIFGSDPFPISGVIFKRDFGASSFSNDAVITPYAGRNLSGGYRGGYSYNVPAASNPYPGFSESSIMALDSYVNTESGFSTRLDSSNAVQAAWGQGETGAPTRVSPEGKLILRDAPAAYTPDEAALFSVAQLQHADLTADDEALGTGLQAGNAVGNSWYSFVVPRAESVSAPANNWTALRYSNFSNASEPGDSPRYPGYVLDLPKATQIRRHDISYLLNAALWDTFYFSTLRPAAGSSTTVAPLPANRRLVYAAATPTLGQLRASDTSTVFTDPSALGIGENGRASSAWLLTNGAFNVNSTSVEAWKAVLSGLRGLAANTVATATANVTPFAHTIRQTDGAQTVLATNVATVAATYEGYRALTDAQISALAAAIVDEVKARGPFLSLSQFVNRRLVPAAVFGDPVGDTGLAGAIQRAIDRTDINLNLLKVAKLANTGSEVVYVEDSKMPTGDTSGLGYYQGAPGWLTQADVLQSIASSLSARSDTFVIRTYGEVIDPVNSPAAPAAPVVTGRAWCEAVVQRMPDYVDATVRPTVIPSAAGLTNQTFGRRFKVISFRWLSPDDI